MGSRDAYFQAYENVGNPTIASRNAYVQVYKNVGARSVENITAIFDEVVTDLSVVFDASDSFEEMSNPSARNAHFQGYGNVT